MTIYDVLPEVKKHCVFYNATLHDMSMLGDILFIAIEVKKTKVRLYSCTNLSKFSGLEIVVNHTPITSENKDMFSGAKGVDKAYSLKGLIDELIMRVKDSKT